MLCEMLLPFQELTSHSMTVVSTCALADYTLET